MSSSSKRQTTMAKMQREQRVRERRVAKQEKKQAAAAAKIAEANGEALPSDYTPVEEEELGVNLNSPVLSEQPARDA